MAETAGMRSVSKKTGKSSGPSPPNRQQSKGRLGYGNSGNCHQTADSGVKTCISKGIVEDLFSKADKLIDSGKKRQMCTFPEGGHDVSIISKYVNKCGQENKPLLDTRVEAIIKRYSDSTCTARDMPRGSTYPIFPLTPSPLSFKHTFPEGGVGACSSIGSICYGKSFGLDVEKKNSVIDKSDGSSRSQSKSILCNIPPMGNPWSCESPTRRIADTYDCPMGGNTEAMGGKTGSPAKKTVAVAGSKNKPRTRSISGGSTGSNKTAVCQPCIQQKRNTTSKGTPQKGSRPCANKSANKSMADRTNNGRCPCASSQPTSKPNCPTCRTNPSNECGDATPKSPCPCKPEPCAAKPKKPKKKPGARHIIVEEAKRAYGENQQLKLEGMELRKEMECTRKGLMVECAKVLHSVLMFCEERSMKERGILKSEDRHKVCGSSCTQSRKGAGCSTGMCGGYTPSGWNKANAHSGAEVSDCLPPRAPVPPCPPRGGGGENPNQQEGQDAVVSGVVDCNMCPSVRILGEMVFQLERRILEYVFGVEGKTKRRFYGYTVSNVCYMITKESTVPSGKTDNIGKSDKACRFEKIMCALQKYGYNVKVHPEFCQNIVNKFGVLACPPDQCTIDSFRLQDPCAVSGIISKVSGSPSEVVHLNIILRCLAFLSRCDGKPMFVW